MALEQYISKHNLYLRDEPSNPAVRVEKGALVKVYGWFRDPKDEVRCADALVVGPDGVGRRLSIPGSYLKRAPGDTGPAPSDALKAAGDIRGVYGAPPD